MKKIATTAPMPAASSVLTRAEVLIPWMFRNGEDRTEKQRPRPVGDAGRENMRLLAAPHDADHGIEHVIHDHAPSGDVAEGGIDFLPDIGERRTGAGIGARHAPVTERGEEHGNHGDQQRGDDVPAAAITQYAEDGHGSDRLDYDDAVENQIAQRKRAPQARGAAGHVR